jgi:RNA polymerase sigma factor FliA
MDAAALWQSYLDDGDPTARDQLVEEHLHLVYETGRKVIGSSSRDAKLEELLGVGTLGLMNAIDSFDPSGGLPFQAVASLCIREAILNDLRAQGDHYAAVGRWVPEVRPLPYLTYLPEQEEELPDDDCLEADLAALPELQGEAQGEDLDEGPVDRRHVGILRDEILKLGHEERLVVSLYYFQGLKLREIALLMGLGESKVSSIREEALQQLRDRLKESGISGASEGAGVGGRERMRSQESWMSPNGGEMRNQAGSKAERRMGGRGTGRFSVRRRPVHTKSADETPRASHRCGRTRNQGRRGRGRVA